MRVAIRKTDGHIIEAQSNDAASFVSLRRNAREAGYAEADIEFRVIPDAECEARIRAQQPPQPKSALQIVIDYLAENPDAPEELKQHATRKVK